MSTLDYTRFVAAEKAARLTNAQARMSLGQFPPILERLLGVWAPLSRRPCTGITADGHPIEGLLAAGPDGAQHYARGGQVRERRPEEASPHSHDGGKSFHRHD